jgi:hypothetical protein
VVLNVNLLLSWGMIPLHPGKYKYLKYTISNPGKLPLWHLGAGNPTWLFVDELLYR